MPENVILAPFTCAQCQALVESAPKTADALGRTCEHTQREEKLLVTRQGADRTRSSLLGNGLSDARAVSAGACDWLHRS